MKTLLTILLIVFTVGILLAQSPTPSPSGDDNLKNSMAELVKTTTTTLNQTKNFVVDQAPEVFQQYLSWQIFCAKGWAYTTGAISILLILLSLIFFIPPDMRECAGAGCFFVFIALVIFFFGTLDNIMTIQKIKIAPKVYLLEYAKSLTK